MRRLRGKKYNYLPDIIGMAFACFLYIIPFSFVIFTSLKDRRDANSLTMNLPSDPQWRNYGEVLKTADSAILRGFKNSAIITFFSVIILIFVSSIAAYAIQRRNDKLSRNISFLFLLGLIVPPAILPTIWVLESLNIFKSMFSMVMIEVALQLPFTIMLYRSYMASIPKDLDEAAIIDGCSGIKLFIKIIFPLLKPVTSTVIILNSVTIFNDFKNPLYFLPGSKRITIQQTLYNYSGRYSSSYNLLFADVVLITLPMLILFLFFNKKIVAGMTAGSVKG